MTPELRAEVEHWRSLGAIEITIADGAVTSLRFAPQAPTFAAPPRKKKPAEPKKRQRNAHSGLVAKDLRELMQHRAE